MRVYKPKIVEKPWGREIWVAMENEYGGKILEIKKGFTTSLHYHTKKKETMFVLDGVLRVYTPKETYELNSGESITVEPGDVHRLEAVTDVRLIEFSTPELKDTVRVEDYYNRPKEDF